MGQKASLATVSAPNGAKALQLMQFLAGEVAQRIYADVNFEYPVRAGVEWPDLLKSLGDFKVDAVDLSAVAANRAAAIRLVNEVDYDG